MGAKLPCVLPRAPVQPAAQSLSTAAQAIVRAVAYTDIFDYPLTAAEIHRYLPEVALPEAELLELIRRVLLPGRLLGWRDDLYMLPGREYLVDIRRRRAAVAAQVWPQALLYGRKMARLPFVQMVAVTGALAFDNVESDADIDYLIVCERGRLWICRALIIAAVVRRAARMSQLCPNYLMSESALNLADRSLYTAYELSQMRLISGVDTYGRLMEANGWIRDKLPNAVPLGTDSLPVDTPRLHWRAVSALLGTPAGTWLEGWEMNRKIRRFRREARDEAEAEFSADCCKGHFGAHRAKTLGAWKSRLEQLGLETQ